MSAVNTSGRERPAAPPGAVAILLAHGWERGLLDVGAQALMRGLAAAFPRCVRGCPYLTAGVEQVGHMASDGNSPAVASPPPVREVCASRRRRRGGSGRPRLPRDGPHERGQLAREAVQVTVVFLPRAVSAR